MGNRERLKIVFLDSFTTNPGDLSWTALESLGEFSHFENIIEGKDIIQKAEDAEVVILNKAKITEATLQHLTKVKLFCVAATGYNSIDVEACRKKGIPVCNVSGYSSPAVAQHVFSLILALQNKVSAYSQEVSNNKWSSQNFFSYQNQSWFELKDKTMGIFGLGKIGEQVAQIALAFGMRVLAYRKHANKGSIPGVRLVDRDTLFRESDYLSLHTALNKETIGLINRESLSKMKSSAYLINTGRGPLIVEEDLRRALEDGVIAGAGLDVLSSEPPELDHVLFNAPNCLITPHIAWGSFESRTRLVEGLVSNIQNFIKGSPTNVVN